MELAARSSRGHQGVACLPRPFLKEKANGSRQKFGNGRSGGAAVAFQWGMVHRHNILRESAPYCGPASSRAATVPAARRPLPPAPLRPTKQLRNRHARRLLKANAASE